jgi:hypothetical protein
MRVSGHRVCNELNIYQSEKKKFLETNVAEKHGTNFLCPLRKIELQFQNCYKCVYRYLSACFFS